MDPIKARWRLYDLIPTCWEEDVIEISWGAIAMATLNSLSAYKELEDRDDGGLEHHVDNTAYEIGELIAKRCRVLGWGLSDSDSFKLVLYALPTSDHSRRLVEEIMLRHVDESEPITHELHDKSNG